MTDDLPKLRELVTTAPDIKLVFLRHEAARDRRLGALAIIDAELARRDMDKATSRSTATAE